LRENALNTVRHAEFGIPSCNFGYNESVEIGKHLVSFLNMYMPHLQTLRLWRPDDFPWTSRKFISNHKYQLERVIFNFNFEKPFFIFMETCLYPFSINFNNLY
jgi:hypothetical protein